MVLDFGKGSLFRPTSLEQETGVIAERWDQDGSERKTFNVSLTASAAVYTVTTGKRLFVSSINIPGASSGEVALRDGGAAGTIKFSHSQAAVGTFNYIFPVALYFDTDLYYTEVSAYTGGTMIINGWEESVL